eukprot:9484422-Pyramimonas_sp.AAC.1
MVEPGDARRKVVFLTDRVSDSSPLDPGSRIHYIDDVDIAQDGIPQNTYAPTSHHIPTIPTYPRPPPDPLLTPGN